MSASASAASSLIAGCVRRTLWYPLQIPATYKNPNQPESKQTTFQYFMGYNKPVPQPNYSDIAVVPAVVQITPYLAVSITSFRDDRCPESATCVWAGQVAAKVMLWVRDSIEKPWSLLGNTEIGDHNVRVLNESKKVYQFRGYDISISGGELDNTTRILTPGYGSFQVSSMNGVGQSNVPSSSQIAAGQVYLFPITADLCPSKRSSALML